MGIKFPANNTENYSQQRMKWDKAQQYLAELDALDRCFEFKSRDIIIIESNSKKDLIETLKKTGPYYTDMNDNKFCKFGVVHLRGITSSYMWCYPIKSL